MNDISEHDEHDDLTAVAAAVADQPVPVSQAHVPTNPSVVTGGRLDAPELGALPKSKRLRRMLGPSVLLLGVSLGSGEFVVFPALTHQFGFVLMWAAWVGFVTQFFLNMEIERYTLVTGESICTGFARVSAFWVWVVFIMNIVPWVWPGWATGAGECLAFAFGGSYVFYSLIALVGIGLALSLGPVVFRTVLYIQLVLIAMIFTFMLLIGGLVVSPDLLVPLASGMTSVGYVPDGIDWPLFLTALAFAGAGGSLNLGQSAYVRDKQWGMAAGFSVLRSPITGEYEPTRTIGRSFDCQTNANMRRWSAWWRAANWEHVLTFLIPGLVSILLLSLITYSTIGPGGDPDGMLFIDRIASAIGARCGSIVRIIYLLMGAAILFTTELGILDVTSRISATIVKTNVPMIRKRERITEGHLYIVFLWIEIFLSVLVLGFGISEPVRLLRIAGSLNAMIMVVYAGLLIYMNSGRILHPKVSMSGWRLGAMLWAFGFYGYFSIVLLRSLGF